MVLSDTHQINYARRVVVIAAILFIASMLLLSVIHDGLADDPVVQKSCGDDHGIVYFDPIPAIPVFSTFPDDGLPGERDKGGNIVADSDDNAGSIIKRNYINRNPVIPGDHGFFNQPPGSHGNFFNPPRNPPCGGSPVKVSEPGTALLFMLGILIIVTIYRGRN